MAGTDCTATPDACCSDSTCVGTSSTAICRAICHTGAECNSGCCAPLNNAAISVCSDPSLCPSPGGHCPDLVVAANDGTYLGDAMSNAYAANGVCNQYSLYGSNYGVDSIHNPNGLYGSSYSVTSAYNPYTTTPPVLFCKSSKAVLGPVTKNATLVGAVDPDSLCSTLAGAGY